MRHAYFPLFLALLLGAAGSRAQESALQLMPDGLIAVARMKGPAELGRLFEKTNLGRMLAGPEMAKHLAQALKEPEEELERLLSQAGHEYTDLKKKVLAYGGEITAGVGVLDSGALKAADGPDMARLGLWIVLVVGPDGETDLPGLCRAIEELAEKEAGEEFQDLKVEGRLFRAHIDEEQEFGFTLPAMVGRQLVVHIGTSLERSIASSLHGEQRDRAALAEALGAAGVCMHMDLDMVMKLAAAGIEAALANLPFAGEDEQQGPARKIPRLIELLGLDALGSIIISVVPDKECVRVDAGIDLARGTGRGLVWVMAPEKAGASALLDLVPWHRTDWAVQTLRLDLVYQMARQVIELFADEIGKRPAELETAFQDLFRVRLKEDLIDHLGNELITLDLSGEPGLSEAGEEQHEDEGMGMLLGALGPSCYGLSLKDPAAFGRSLETLLRSRGFHATRKTESYRGMDLHKLSLFGFPLHYAVTGRVFLVGPGPGGAAAMRAILDEEADRKEGKERAKPPEEVARRLALCPPDRAILSVTNLTVLLDDLKGNPSIGFPDEEEEEDVIGIVGGSGRVASKPRWSPDALLAALPALFKAYKLEFMVAAGWTKDGRLGSSTLW